jgi:hypothetical protein
MNCGTCGAEADRSCTRCGRPFCPLHGGMRKCVVGKGVDTRALCDDCTPNQWWLTYGAFIALALFAGIVAVVYFNVIQPQREAFELRREQNERDFKRRQEEMEKPGFQPGGNQPGFPRPAPVQPNL